MDDTPFLARFIVVRKAAIDADTDKHEGRLVPAGLEHSDGSGKRQRRGRPGAGSPAPLPITRQQKEETAATVPSVLVEFP